MSDLKIERATPTETVSVIGLLDAAATWQQGHGIDMWEQGRFPFGRGAGPACQGRDPAVRHRNRWMGLRLRRAVTSRAVVR